MKKQSIFDMAAFLGSLIFWSWLYMRFFYAYVAVVFYNNQPEWNLLIPASIILTLTAISSLFIRGLYSRHIPRWQVVASYALYFIILFYALFLKNIGKQGFSIDLQSFTYNWIYGDKLVPTMNIIMFIPLGFLCKLSWTHVAYFTLAISLVEGSQYLFHLGIFDLGDILTNLLGFIIGSYLLETALGKWVVRHIH